MRCAWAAPPRRMLRGLRAHQRVNAHFQRFACEQHTAIDTESSKVQTHCLKMTDFRRFLPNGSAVWRAHRLASRPHRFQKGEMASLEPRHAVTQLLMLPNPHHHRHEGCRTTSQRTDRSSRCGRLAGRPRCSPSPRPGPTPRNPRVHKQQPAPHSNT